MKTLVVWAHPNPDSFTARWARETVAAASGVGEALTSDLYAMGFDPVEGANHFDMQASGFDPLKAQEDLRPPEDVSTEVAKLLAADVAVFHFPLWWFGPPAMIKGWFDRVLVHGALHDVSHRFDKGRLRGKRALFCVSTGADAYESGPSGREGDARLLLWPAAMTLRYLGMTVHEPVFAHGVHGYYKGADKKELETRLKKLLSGQPDLLKTLADRPALPFNSDADFDPHGRLRPDAPQHWPFTRHSR